tara:strand:+ start:155 stop:520 length:366 start_codon:yes stop_codon:yes gene_type:complete
MKNKVEPRIKKLYYSISEVSELSKLKPYVLRYWETEFKELAPPKNRAGNRTYRQKDINIVLTIKDLLYNKKFTIDGARNILKGKNIGTTSSEKNQVDDEKRKLILSKIKTELNNILKIISN